uniref:Uncharacterized protein n=1 Tax=Mycena chlorophos TaxID=658473 RepID=A0ABQ0KW06_MYCCL|nr:predicted protein [Mycena chlorophos]
MARRWRAEGAVKVIPVPGTHTLSVLRGYDTTSQDDTTSPQRIQSDVGGPVWIPRTFRHLEGSSAGQCQQGVLTGENGAAALWMLWFFEEKLSSPPSPTLYAMVSADCCFSSSPRRFDMPSPCRPAFTAHRFENRRRHAETFSATEETQIPAPLLIVSFRMPFWRCYHPPASPLPNPLALRYCRSLLSGRSSPRRRVSPHALAFPN